MTNRYDNDDCLLQPVYRGYISDELGARRKVRVHYSSEFSDNERIAIVDDYSRAHTWEADRETMLSNPRAFKLRMYKGLLLGRYDSGTRVVNHSSGGFIHYQTAIHEYVAYTSTRNFVFKSRDRVTLWPARSDVKGYLLNGELRTRQYLARFAGVPEQKISHIVHQNGLTFGDDITDALFIGTARSGGLYIYEGKMTYLCYLLKTSEVTAIQLGKWLRENGYPYGASLDSFFASFDVRMGRDNWKVVVEPSQNPVHGSE